MTCAAFIEASRKKYGEHCYDYSRVQYVNNSTKVELICIKCRNTFMQDPRNHLHACKVGCPACAHQVQTQKRRCSQQDFINKATIVHGQLYDYKHVLYVNKCTNVDIMCNRCQKVFKQTPDSHVNQKSGCRPCNAKLQHIAMFDTKESFVAKAQKVHGRKYNYDKTLYVRSSQQVDIVCSQHGVFQQRPNDHVKGRGCPVCSSNISAVSLLWLEYMQVKDNTYIQHGHNGSEYRISGTRFRADGYSATLHKVYEFLGDFYHGNPSRYPLQKYNSVAHKTMGQLYGKTMARNMQIINAGYNLEYIWEADFARMIKSAKKIQKWWRRCRSSHRKLCVSRRLENPQLLAHGCRIHNCDQEECHDGFPTP